MTYASTARLDESVVSLSEMLGTRGVAVSSRVGRAPNARTGLTAGELLLREGYQGLSIGVADGPRHYREDAILRAREPEEVAASAESPARSGARMRLATATGAMVALGSLVGASTMNSGSSPSAVVATVRELGNVYAGHGVLSGPNETPVVTRSRSQSQSAAGSLAPLRGSAPADRPGASGLTTRWARPEPVSDVRPDGRPHRATPDHAQVLAAPDAQQASGRSSEATGSDARSETSSKKRWPFSGSKKNDPAAGTADAQPGRSATLDKAARSNDASGPDKTTRPGKSAKSDTGTKSDRNSTADRLDKSSKSDRSSSKQRSSSDGNGKHSSSSGTSGSSKGGSHGGHSSGKGGGHKN